MLGLAWGWNMAGMIKTTFPGVRYREHKTRKHGIRADRYFFIRYRLEGRINTPSGNKRLGGCA